MQEMTIAEIASVAGGVYNPGSTGTPGGFGSGGGCTGPFYS